MRIAVGRLHFNHIISHFKHRDVEGPAAEVEDRYLFVFLFIKSIRERGGRRLIDNALHVESGNLSRGFGCTPLVIVEIGRNRDNRLRCSFSPSFASASAFNLPSIIAEISSGGTIFRPVLRYRVHFHLDAAVLCLAHFKWHRCLVLLHIRLRQRSVR